LPNSICYFLEKMKIDCYISESCSSEDSLRTNLAEALKHETVDAVVSIHIINDREAQRIGLMGSPSVLIDGVDILPGRIPGFS